MLKVTTKQLFEMRDVINADGIVKADIYFANQMGLPGRPQFCARDRQGVERVLVVWPDGWAIDQDSCPDVGAMVDAALGEVGA